MHRQRVGVTTAQVASTSPLPLGEVCRTSVSIPPTIWVFFFFLPRWTDSWLGALTLVPEVGPLARASKDPGPGWFLPLSLR